MTDTDTNWLDKIYDCELGWSIDNPTQLNFMGFVINMAKLAIVTPKDLPTYKQYRVLELFTNVLNHQLREGMVAVNLQPFDVSTRMVFSLRRNSLGHYMYSASIGGLVAYICIPRNKIREFTDYNIKTVVPDITANPEEYIRHLAFIVGISNHKSFADCDRVEVIVHDITTKDTAETENSARIVKQVLSFDIVCWGSECVFGTSKTKTVVYENGCGPSDVGDIFGYFSVGYAPKTLNPDDHVWSSYMHLVDAQTKQIVSADYQGPVEFTFHHPNSSIKASKTQTCL